MAPSASSNSSGLKVNRALPDKNLNQPLSFFPLASSSAILASSSACFLASLAFFHASKLSFVTGVRPVEGRAARCYSIYSSIVNFSSSSEDSPYLNSFFCKTQPCGNICRYWQSSPLFGHTQLKPYILLSTASMKCLQVMIVSGILPILDLGSE